MLHPLRSCLALALLAAPAAAQSTWVRIDFPPDSAVAAFLLSEGFDVLHESEATGTIEIILPDSDLPRLEDFGLPMEIVGHSRPLRDLLLGRNFDPNFYDWGELNQKMLDVQNAFPSIAQRVDITALTGAPLTHEGRNIYALKISDNVGTDEDEPATLFVGNHHAREISTPVSMVDMMDHLTTQYGIDALVTDAVDGQEIWIVPTLNPDGLEYAWNVDQWWRKNRRNNGGGVFGVDLNRNYDFKWRVCGNWSSSTSSSTYTGPSPESEPETQTLTGLARMKRFAKVIDHHTSGQEVLYPYTCGNLDLENRNEIWEIRDTLANAANYAVRLASSGGEHFEWEYAEIGAISYLMELDTTFFPTWSQALAENNRIRPAMRAMLDQPIPLSGHVYDAWSGAPIQDADVALSGVTLFEGELRRSGPFGRYHYWVEDGTYDVTTSKAGFFDATTHNVTIGAGGTVKELFVNPSDRPYIELDGTPVVGNLIRWKVDNAAAHVGEKCTIVLSGSGGGPFVPGIPNGGFIIPLVNDNVTSWGLNRLNLLQVTIGVGGFGFTPLLSLPPGAAGLHIWASGVIQSGSVTTNVTPAMDFQIP